MRANARDAWPPGWDRMNHLEQDWSTVLTANAEVLKWRFEGITLRLADATYYKPDFYVVLRSGLIEIHETKGFQREAARVRINVAAEQYPEFLFKKITRPDERKWKSWEITFIPGAGEVPESVDVPPYKSRPVTSET